MASTLNETVREDGLRIITKQLKSTKKVFVCVSALAGSADDPDDKEGLFHFFEHMGFKGTKTRSMSQIKEVLGLLVSSNAYTADLRTTYYGEAVYTKLSLLQDIIFDIYINSVFPEEEIEKEKEVVLNEAAMYEDNDSYKAYNILGELLWQHNPRRRVGVGTPHGLANISREVLLDTHAHWYDHSNTVVVAVGRVEHNKFVNDVNAVFPAGSVKVKRATWSDESEIIPANYVKILERKNREKGVVVWGCKIPKLPDNEKIAMKILTCMIGGGFDSMLWSEVREKRGLVYSARAHYDDCVLAPYAAFQAEMLPKRLDEVRLLMYEVVASHELNHKHFLRTKSVIEDECLLALETPGDWGTLIHNKIVDERKDILFLNNYAGQCIKQLRKINFEDVVELRKRLLCPERLVLAAVKPC